jgi:hypothetical protein
MDQENDRHEKDAASIQSQGWRQGSAFRPPADFSFPGYINFQVGNEWLVVCTQSCSVCSANFTNEPLVEVIVASELQRYNPNHSDAKGKSNHSFHLPINGMPNTEALFCQLGKRFFIPRVLLSTWQPEKTWIELGVLNAFKGWLANYYMRVALPDELVRRLKLPGGIKEIVNNALTMQLDGTPLNEFVSSIWIEWRPDEDLPSHKFYELSLIIVCDNDESREFLDRQLASLIGTAASPLTIEGVIVSELHIEVAENITLNLLAGKSRYNEFDALSNLPERLFSLRSTT